MNNPPTDRTAEFYGSLVAFQNTHRLPGLQHAQIRGLLAEHLARAFPAVPPTTTDRDRIAAPTVWIDGHPQLEAIAAAVWESCRTEESSTVVDDPRNIAVAALAAVLAVPSAGSEDTTTVEPLTEADRGEEDGIRQWGDYMRGWNNCRAEVLAAPPAEPRAILRKAAEQILAADFGPRPGHSEDYGNGWSDSTLRAQSYLRMLADDPSRLADEAQQQPETQTPPRSRAARLLDAITHSGPGYDLTPEPPAVVSAVPPQPEEAEAPSEIVHGCPPEGSGLTPCCGRTPFELPLTDRISSEAPITCRGSTQ